MRNGGDKAAIIRRKEVLNVITEKRIKTYYLKNKPDQKLKSLVNQEDRKNTDPKPNQNEDLATFFDIISSKIISTKPSMLLKQSSPTIPGIKQEESKSEEREGVK